MDKLLNTNNQAKTNTLSIAYIILTFSNINTFHGHDHILHTVSK